MWHTDRMWHRRQPRSQDKLLSLDEIVDLLRSKNAHQRFAYYQRAVRTEHLHDFHYPDPLGPPKPAQPCAQLLKGTLNMWYCGNGYPRSASLATDPWRRMLCDQICGG